jgi:hypothetical protein
VPAKVGVDVCNVEIVPVGRQFLFWELAGLLLVRGPEWWQTLGLLLVEEAFCFLEAGSGFDPGEAFAWSMMPVNSVGGGGWFSALSAHLWWGRAVVSAVLLRFRSKIVLVSSERTLWGQKDGNCGNVSTIDLEVRFGG